jgi:two-component system, NarL family, sensor histidine kinase BarA
MNVLLVCNEADTRTIFEDFCRAAHYPLVNFSSLSDAAAVMESQNFDVLIVEDCTSNLAGLPTIRDQRKRVSPPFVLIVANNSELEASAALNLKADGFLTKPIQPALIALNFTQASKRHELQIKVREAEDESTRVHEELRESLGRQRQATTEKNLTYRELLLAYSRLQDLNRQRNNFLSMATHELRTPVTVMKGYHRILLDEHLGKLQPQQREVLLESEQSCTRLVRIINSLLDLSQIEAGKLELIFRESDFVDNIKAVIRQTEEACKRKDLTLVLQVEKDIPRFKFDRDRVNRVVTNLLENSIKYTPRGGKIYLSVQPHFWERRTPSETTEGKAGSDWRQQPLEANAAGSNAVMVQVRDTGIGISPEHQQEIFDQFTQVSSNHMSRSGLGLGLAISKRIIDTHGGKIWVDSRVNSGSTFIFVLPLNPPDSSNLNNESILTNREGQESAVEKL